MQEEELNEIDRSVVLESPPKGLAKLIARLKPNIYTIRGQIIQAHNGTFKRLLWATTGKEQANLVIREISDLNSRLHQLLDSLEQERRAQVDGVLLRDILSRSSTASDVEQIQEILAPSTSLDSQAIQAAATLKQIRLVIGVDKRDDEINTPPSMKTRQTMPSITKLKHKKLAPYVLGVPIRYKGIEFARYNRKPVLVEWKSAEGAMWEKLYDQVRFLAVMLASPAVKDLQSLLCIGFLPWEERELYALVYNIPEAMPQDEPDHWRLKSLHDLILEQPQLSLGRRFEIARKMAEVMLQLHTAGWLHKSFRSENIVFLASKDSSPDDFLQGQPYLIGYEYARPDSSEAAMFTQLPDTELAADLYRHPQARGAARERYQKRFDMYALGCVLIEIALWQRLLDVKTTYINPSLPQAIKEAVVSNKDIDLPSFLDLSSQTDLVKGLTHCSGETLVEAVCLSFSMEKVVASEGDVSLDNQQALIKKLHQCKC